MQSTLWRQPTYVYLAFNDARELLYTGIAGSWRDRFNGHRSHSPWFEDATWFMLKHYSNRLDAIAEESYIINHNEPIWNIKSQHGYCRCGHIDPVDSFDYYPGEGVVRF